ncbi:hypothetical protein AJ78_01974 [Emergomyces pasteurianus Ep9510]|uniref:Uncharacterized protein n=1 Tax=Emergomyces pasteurianus Ep9510 TaxID=1447872 RepID=A0A1J9QP31_9EURO|nr:hypothetical protein AJ78_01974 [Emergomyces pasteurianus Ep9510]
MAETEIRILVWRGWDFEDTKLTNHTAVLFRVPGAETGYYPSNSNRMAGSVWVAIIKQAVSEAGTPAAQAPANNNMNRWNCHNGIGDGQQKFVDNGLIAQKKRLDTVEKMVDILVQGADDNYAGRRSVSKVHSALVWLFFNDRA